MAEQVLSGCTPTILASYLKALAVHRLVSAQKDPEATSHWDPDGRFCFDSALDQEALCDFFLSRYVPTPIVTPWNGGGGFYPKDQQAGIKAIEDSSDPRFQPYGETIAACRRILKECEIEEKPGEEKKGRLLLLLRAELPDIALEWLDAAYVMGEDPSYPAILGTGGNDGRLDFANNFMQRLVELMLAPPQQRRGHRGADVARRALRAALFGESHPDVLQAVPIGQFAPVQAGGSNMSTDFSADSRANPWDYVLALEGALVFACAALRRLESSASRTAAFPFHFEASPVGYAASADADRGKARGELWLPLWDKPARFGELARFFSEGRVEVGRHRAITGLDAARAIAGLGIDRGVGRFERISIQQRNGLAYLATSLGTFHVPSEPIPGTALLEDLEPFVSAVERRRDELGPAVAAALRAVREASYAVCTDPTGQKGRLADVLAAAGALSRAVSRSRKLRERVGPLQKLKYDWIGRANDRTPEFAIAAAFASWGAREDLEPVERPREGVVRWVERRPAWDQRDPLDNLAALALRRLQRVQDGKLPFAGASQVGVEDLLSLLHGHVNVDRLEDLLFGLSCVHGKPDERYAPRTGTDGFPDGIYCLLRAVLSPKYLLTDSDRHPAPQTAAAILTCVCAGHMERAVELARRRLVASECPPLLPPGAGFMTHRRPAALAAALVVPLPEKLERDLIGRVISGRTSVTSAALEAEDPNQEDAYA